MPNSLCSLGPQMPTVCWFKPFFLPGVKTHYIHFFTWNFINFIHSCVSVGCSLSCLLNSSVLPVKGVALGSDFMSRLSCSACTWRPFPWSQRAVEESYTPRGFTAADCTSPPGLKRHVVLKISHTKETASALVYAA